MTLQHRRPARLAGMPGIGVDRMGDMADTLADPAMLRLENLDTDIRPYAPALEATRRAVDADSANSYLPFLGQDGLRQAAAAHVGRLAGVAYDWRSSCVISAGGGGMSVSGGIDDEGWAPPGVGQSAASQMGIAQPVPTPLRPTIRV